MGKPNIPARNPTASKIEVEVPIRDLLPSPRRVRRQSREKVRDLRTADIVLLSVATDRPTSPPKTRGDAACEAVQRLAADGRALHRAQGQWSTLCHDLFVALAQWTDWITEFEDNPSLDWADCAWAHCHPRQAQRGTSTPRWLCAATATLGRKVRRLRRGWSARQVAEFVALVLLAAGLERIGDWPALVERTRKRIARHLGK